jgi:hypothetical protein
VASKIGLTEDPRYKAFVERYCFDPLRFCIEVAGITPTWQQVDLLEAVAVPGARVSVSSGHGCFAAGAQILRADGSLAAVEDISVNDTLMGPDGASLRKVLSLARGREEMYRFTYEDGTNHTVNRSHILCLAGPGGRLDRVSVGRWLSWSDAQRRAYQSYRLTAPAASGSPARYKLVSIASVEAMGDGEYFGFTLDGDGLFLGADDTVLSNTGKTNMFALIALWHLCVYAKSNCIITAPRLATVHDGVWKEFAGHHAAIKAGPHKWIGDYIKVEHEKVYIEGSKLDWWITAKTAPVGRPENIAGAHNKWLLWLCDEASGIPDKNFGVIGGSLTDENNRMVLASQPTRTSGFFRETHHSMSRENGGPWVALTFNSEDSPLVSDQFILDKLREYGGEDSPEYQIKVRGKFPEFSDKYLLSRRMIERVVAPATRAIADDEPYGNFLIIDVAAGVFRDKTVGTHLRVAGYGDRLDPNPRRVDVIDIPIFTNSLDWQEVAGRAHEIAAGLSNCTVLVDVGGQGVQFAKMLENLGTPNVIKVNWGNMNFLDRLKKRFVNQRAQCSVNAADAVKDGRITFTEKYKKELLDQGSRIPFFFDEKGRWQIMSKVDMKKEGIPSPDLWDTICMAFLEDAHYITDESSGQYLADDRVKTARAAADEEFADA